jgi:hypothetical protein
MTLSFRRHVSAPSDPGTAMWLRGAWYRFTSSKRAMHRSVSLHLRQFPKLVCIKLNKVENPESQAVLGKTSALFNPIQTHPCHERRLRPIRAAIARRPDRV